MALYTIRKIVSVGVVGQRALKRERTQSVGIGAKPLALLVPSIALVMLMSTYSFAGSYLLTKSISGSEINAGTVAQLPPAHSAVLAAAFGFQAAGSSIITVRTYDAPTGAILSEDSFDVHVKEEGATVHDESKERIFAGGIGTDSEGKPRFMLRVYDAETGRFLWEGQLNLLKVGEGGMTNTAVALIPNNSPMVQASSVGPVLLQTLFSLRAVNPATGGLVWQDQFAPGSRKDVKANGVLFGVPTPRPIHEPIEHSFDLIVRTYDRTSGKLLWEDSFEQLDRIEEPGVEPDSNAYPQAIPSWTSIGVGNGESHRMGLR